MSPSPESLVSSEDTSKLTSDKYNMRTEVHIPSFEQKPVIIYLKPKKKKSHKVNKDKTSLLKIALANAYRMRVKQEKRLEKDNKRTEKRQKRKEILEQKLKREEESDSDDETPSAGIKPFQIEETGFPPEDNSIISFSGDINSNEYFSKENTKTDIEQEISSLSSGDHSWIYELLEVACDVNTNEQPPTNSELMSEFIQRDTSNGASSEIISDFDQNDTSSVTILSNEYMSGQGSNVASSEYISDYSETNLSSGMMMDSEADLDELIFVDPAKFFGS